MTVCYICKAKPFEANSLGAIYNQNFDNKACALEISSLHSRTSKKWFVIKANNVS